jgi:hypothetical protein
MAAIDLSLVSRSEAAVHQLVKRKNWAAREPGVIVVFAIVGAVAILVVGLFIQKKVSLLLAHCYCIIKLMAVPRSLLARRRARKDTPFQFVREWV